jgi:hypothetical protein
MAAWTTRRAQYVDESTDPRYLDCDRLMEGLRKAGMPEE